MAQKKNNPPKDLILVTKDSCPSVLYPFLWCTYDGEYEKCNPEIYWFTSLKYYVSESRLTKLIRLFYISEKSEISQP